MVAAVPQFAIDLGSGGGLPGLVLALEWPSTRWTFIESNQRRAAWLERAVAEAGATRRVEVLCERAEKVARGSLRGSSDVVTARSFAAPAPTAECAAALLKPGARLLVTEPPDSPSTRWPAEGLAKLGLVLEKAKVIDSGAGPVSLSSLMAASLCPPRYPRRVGVPQKRPLF
jgi:16S rRNA (guanine527-N7)-methyltransferase